MRQQTAQSAKFHQVNLHLDNDAAVVFKHHLVHDGRPLTIRSGANQIIWGYSLLTQVFPTYGGEVQQILGARIEDLTISGQTRDNHQLEQIYDFFKAYMTIASGFGATNKFGQRSEEPIVFTYPTRKWSFSIQVTDLSGFQIGTGLVATPWQIKAIIVPTEDADGSHIGSKVVMNSLTKVLVPSKGIPLGIGYNTENSYSDPNFGGVGQPLDELGRNAGDQFQKMLGQFSLGDFSSFVFQAGAPTAYASLNQEAKDAYVKIYGTDTLVTNLTGPGGTETAGASGSTSGGGTKGHSTALSDSQNAFVNRFCELSGWDFGFLTVWLRAEEGILDKVPAATVNGKPIHQPSGDYNYLNIFGSDGNFDTPKQAAEFTWKWLKTPGMARADINSLAKTVSGKSVPEAISLLGKTGWDAAHYGNPPGSKILSLWNGTYKATITYTGKAGSDVQGDGTTTGKVYAMATVIDKKNLDYGPGGHGLGWDAAQQTTNLDCSSSTSVALWAGGLMDGVTGPQVSDWFLTWGEAGEGKTMTVWVHPGSGDNGHVWIEFKGRPAVRFDTSPWGSGPNGPHLRTGQRDNGDHVANGFVARRYHADA